MKNSIIYKVTCLLLLVSLVCSNFPINVKASESTIRTESKKAQDKMLEYDSYVQKNIDKLIEKNLNKKSKKVDKVAKLKDNKGNCYDVTMYNISCDEIYESEQESILATTYVYDLSDQNNLSNETNTTTLFTSNETPLIATSNIATLLQTNILQLASNGNTGLEENDSTLSVKGYCTIYYSMTTEAGGNVIHKLTKVSGGYQRLDTSVSVTKQTVVYGEQGTGPSGVIYKSSTKNPTSSSWSYTTNYSGYIDLDGPHSFGVSYNLNLKRLSTGSTWTLSIGNYL